MPRPSARSPIPQPGDDASKTQASGVVEARNVMGAFFRGQLDLIGGP